MEIEEINKLIDKIWNGHICDDCLDEKLILKQRIEKSILGSRTIFICKDCETKREKIFEERKERLNNLFIKKKEK